MTAVQDRRAPAARSMARRVATSLMSNAFAPLAGFAVTPILAQSLGVDGRGAVAAATSPLFLAISVATVGVPGAVTYTIARSPNLVRRVVAPGMLATFAAGLVATAVLAVASTWLGSGDAELVGLITMASLALVPNLLAGVLSAAAAGLHAWGAVARERAVTNGSRLLAIAVLAVLGALTPATAVIVMALSPVLGALFYLPVILRAPHDRTERVAVRPLLSYGARMWIGSLSGVVLSRLDQTLMAPLGGLDQLGLYAVAVSVTGLCSIVNLAVREVVFSADAASTDIDALARAARLSTAATTLGAVVIGATSFWTIPLLFGAEFGDAVPVTIILLVATVVGNSGSVAGMGLAARGRPGQRSLSLTIACVLNVAVLVALTPPLGAIGAAIATLVGNAVSGWGCVLLLRRVTGVPVRAFAGLRRDDLAQVRAVLSIRKGNRR